MTYTMTYTMTDIIIFIILLGVFIVVSFGVFIWACIGLINPKWARFRDRASSVAVLVLAGIIFVGSAGSALFAWIMWVVFDYVPNGPGLTLSAAFRGSAAFDHDSRPDHVAARRGQRSPRPLPVSGARPDQPPQVLSGKRAGGF